MKTLRTSNYPMPMWFGSKFLRKLIKAKEVENKKLIKCRLTDIKILNRATNYFEVSLTYKNGSKEIIIRELNITGNATLSDNYNIGENIQIVDINGFKGIVGTIGNPTSIIKYTDSNIVYVFRSRVGSDELINIAKNFK